MGRAALPHGVALQRRATIQRVAARDRREARARAEQTLRSTARYSDGCSIGLRLHQAHCGEEIAVATRLAVRRLEQDGRQVIERKEKDDAAAGDAPPHRRGRVQLGHVHEIRRQHARQHLRGGTVARMEG